MSLIARNFLVIICLSVLVPSVCFGEWSKVGEGEDGFVLYVDYERIKKKGRFVYFWRLIDYEELKKSSVGFYKLDCDDLFRTQLMRKMLYEERMGKGEFIVEHNQGGSAWYYPNLNSVYEKEIDLVCEFIK